MAFKEDQGQPKWANEEAGRQRHDDLQKALGGFHERYFFDAQGQMDQFDRDMEGWKLGGLEGPAPRLPISPGNMGMETGNFPAPEGVDVDPVTERLGVPEGFQFPAPPPAPPPVQGPQDYPDNSPSMIDPYRHPFKGGQEMIPLGPFPPLPSKPRGPNPFGPPQ